MCPNLECYAQFWIPRFKKEMQVLKCVKRRATNVVKGPEGMSCEEQLRTLLFSGLEKRKLRGNLIDLYRFLCRSKEGDYLFFLLLIYKLPHGRLRLGIRKYFFIKRSSSSLYLCLGLPVAEELELDDL